MAKKRAFVRYSKQGKVVPGSLILTSGSHPNGPSIWKEVPADLCCDNDSCCNKKTISGTTVTPPFPPPPYYVISVRIFCPNNQYQFLEERSSVYTLKTLVGWNTLQEMSDAFYDYSGIEVKITEQGLVSITYCAPKVPCPGIDESGECLQFSLSTVFDSIPVLIAGGCEQGR